MKTVVVSFRRLRPFMTPYEELVRKTYRFSLFAWLNSFPRFTLARVDSDFVFIKRELA